MRDDETGPSGPIAQEPDRQVPCRRCGGMTRAWGPCVAIARSWNVLEERLSKRDSRPPRYLQLENLVECDPCAADTRLELSAEMQTQALTATIYLDELRRGTYTPNTIAWLRGNGYGQQVEHVLAKLMNAPSRHVGPKPKREEKHEDTLEEQQEKRFAGVEWQK